MRSSKSSREAVEYEVWRRWEDCLDFQRTLEVEYHAVSKRRRKGEPALNHHAQNMLYPSQRAASFESLPLGPDPSTIPVDVHAHIPKLSKKSTLFRVNESVIQQRGEEFKGMIEALFDEDSPSTLQELRTVSTVRDFFGYWRRDKEAERKTGKATALGPPQTHGGKGGGPPKQSSVLTPELIAFATGGNITGSSKLKRPSTGKSSQTTSNVSHEAQQVVFNPAYEPGRPTAPAFTQGITPHVHFSASAAAANGGPQMRRPPSFRPVEGTLRVDPLSFRSPTLVNAQPKMPISDSPRSSSPYAIHPISPYDGEFSRPRQSSSPQILSAGSSSSLLEQHSGPVGSVFNKSVPLLHPMQGRTVSMPSQRRHRNGQISSSTGLTDQSLPVPVPRRRNGASDTSYNRSARFFDASTDVAIGPPLKSLNLSEGEDGTNVYTGHYKGLPPWTLQRQAEMKASRRPPAESLQSYGVSDTSTLSPVQTLLSTGYSTSITTPQSSQRSSAATQRHRTAPSWSSRRMSLDSLAPIDMGPYSKDKSRLFATQDPHPRHSVSSDSSYTDGGSSDAAPAPAPSASMPSLILPLRVQPSSAQPPSPPPPRPPRSALRASSIFSSGKRASVTSSPGGSLLTPAEDGEVAVPVDMEPPKRVITNNGVVDSYLEMPNSAKSEDPFELEFRAQPPPPAHRARGRANSTGTGHPMTPIVIPPLPPFPPPDSIAPFSSSEVRPVSPATPLMGQATTIKAIHEASNTILLFRVPRMGTSLADLRAKLSRKFMEAENIQLSPERLELRCLAPASVGTNIANRLSPTEVAWSNGRNRSPSVNPTHADSLWLSLNSEADWHMIVATSSGKVTVKVF